MQKKQKRKTGNVYAIPLPDGMYAFGRQMYDGSLAISKNRSKTIDNPPDFTEIDFYVAVYNDVLTDCEWPKVANIPFNDAEEKYAPNTYIEDSLKPGHYEIYENQTGTIRKATKEKCLGMEVTAVWDRNHVIDRLMGDDKWTRICK